MMVKQPPLLSFIIHHHGLQSQYTYQDSNLLAPDVYFAGLNWFFARLGRETFTVYLISTQTNQGQ